ncbi:MAG: hypothetical protein ACM3ZB_11655 [bacterium]|mgnify:CR=1 FL=1|jgi:hypothetical protein
MRYRAVVLFFAALSLASADTLTLRSGRVVEGSFLGGSARQVRMAVGDRVETFDVGDIESIRFESSQPTTVVPSAPVVTSPVQAAAAQSTPEPQRVQLTPAPAATPQAATASTSLPANASIPAGTQITIRMIDDVDSQVAQVGQTFRASVDDPVMVGGNVVIPRGADVITKLVDLKDPNKLSGGGQLTLDLAAVEVSGRMVDVVTEAVTQAGESRTGNTAKVIGGTAALGAIIGAIAGGGKGAAIGAVSGAGAGTAIQVVTQGPRVRVPSETRLTFTLQAALDAR